MNMIWNAKLPTAPAAQAMSRGAIYEINIRQYTPEGTFRAIIPHLARLKEMGITMLWLMPIHPIGVKERKGELGSYYAVRDYFQVNPEFGSLQDFLALVNSAHALGLKVIIDWVANHTAWDHTWVYLKPEYYATDWDGKFTERNGWSDVIDLNYAVEGLRNAMIAALQYWVDTAQIDGFRCDMAHLVPLDFWREAKDKIKSPKPLFWLAECEEPSYHAVFDATYTWRWMHAAELFLQQPQHALQEFETVLRDYQQLFPQQAMRLFFTSNHDENSHIGSETYKYGLLADALFVLCATWAQSLPLLYSGQEIPLDRKIAFFEKDTIEWPNEFTKERFYSALFHLRQQHPAMAFDVPVERISVSNDTIFAYRRMVNGKQILVWINTALVPQAFQFLDATVDVLYNLWNEADVLQLSSAEVYSMAPGEVKVWIN